MKKEKADLLMNLFKNHQNWVWITDEHWKIEAGEDIYPDKPEWIPEMLRVPVDCWETQEKMIYWEKRFYHAKLYCSREEQCRVITLKNVEDEWKSGENNSVEYVVHSLRQVKEDLQDYLEEYEINNKSELLNSIERNCYLLYHKFYLRRILQSVYLGHAKAEVFCLQEALQFLRGIMEKQMRDYAEINLNLGIQKIFLNENRRFFDVVLLAGLIQCHQHRGYKQKITLSVNLVQEQVKICFMKPDMQKEKSMTNQLDVMHFHSETEECALLDTFCMIHKGEWEVVPLEEKAVAFRIQFPQEELPNKITLHQKSKVLQESSEELCRIMLSKIYLSDF